MCRISTPIRRIRGLTNFVLSSCSRWCATRCFSSETRALTLGAGSSGALGHGSGVLAEDALLPREVVGLPGDLAAVAAGHYHSMAVTAGGQAWCWGRNLEGQLGRGLTNFVLSSCSRWCASRCFSSETRALTFGAGSSGALGHGSGVLAEDALLPREVVGLPGDLAAVAAGHYHSMAVTAGGQVWCWGRNLEGQLGRGHDLMDRSREDWSLPAKVIGLEQIQVKAVAGSGVVSIAVAEDGSVWSWGRSKRGQLGLGTGVTEALLPTQIQALKGRHVVQVTLGWGHALACTSEGELYAWGYGGDGRLGFPPDGLKQQVTNSTAAHGSDWHETQEKERLAALAWEPCLVQELSQHKVLQAAAGLDHSLVLAENGVLFAFGDNSLNQLGSTSKTLIKSLVGKLSGHPVLSISAGLGHSLAVVSRSSAQASSVPSAAFSWGWNVASQLGRVNGEDSSIPGEIATLSEAGVVALAGGRAHSLAVTAAGQLWGWGSGRNGRLGIGSSVDEKLPVLVEDLVEGISTLQAATGYDHSIVLVKS